MNETMIEYPDVALIFEGGAMRNSYTAAVVTELATNKMVFPKVYGISAGAALAVFYCSGNYERAKATFIDSVDVKGAGGLRGLFEGRGFFNLQLILEGLAEMNSVHHDEWTVDFDRLKFGPSDVHIEAFDMDSGDTKAWTRADMSTLTDCMMRVQASCSYPLFTPATEIEGRKYIDGGMGSSHGICLDAAIADGFERFFIVRTQPRNYRMKELSASKRLAYEAAYSSHPKVIKALEERPDKYNELLDRIEELEASGEAYVFCPDDMPVTYKTIERKKLEESYDDGLKQCSRELPLWKAWLNS